MAPRAVTLQKAAAFTPTPKYPLSQALYKANPLRYGAGKSSATAKVDIVSPKLCDDVIKVLLPSLKRHENCDIIDVEPGVGLWSSKLHDAIKPRAHLLLESDSAFYNPFLHPLLDTPKSKYRFASFNGYDFSTYSRIWDEGLLPGREPLTPTDFRYNHPNDSLLLVANLSRYNATRGQYSYVHHPYFVVHSLTKAASQRTLFHRYGLVRMLLWMPNNDKLNILPRTISERNRYTVSVDSSADVQEIAGAGFPASRGHRDPAIDVVSSARVVQRMAESGLSYHGDRDEPASRVSSNGQENQPEESDKAASNDWRAELASLEEGYRKGIFKDYEATIKQKTGRPKKIKSPQYTQLFKLRRKLQAEQLRINKTSALSDQLDRVNELERALQAETLPDEERNVIQKRFEKSQQQFSHESKGLGHHQSQDLAYNIDNRQAIRCDPPLLQWDRRQFEPLQVQDDEFFPQFPLTLLDLQPRSNPYAAMSIGDLDYTELFQGLVSLLFRNPTNSVKKALETLAPGAADALIPLAPSLKNTQLGGRTNLDDLRVRMLTQQMLQELVSAWAEWPFRPSTTDLLLRTGAAEAPILNAKL